jgi:hypothetical protein
VIFLNSNLEISLLFDSGGQKTTCSISSNVVNGSAYLSVSSNFHFFRKIRPKGWVRRAKTNEFLIDNIIAGPTQEDSGFRFLLKNLGSVQKWNVF